LCCKNNVFCYEKYSRKINKSEKNSLKIQMDVGTIYLIFRIVILEAVLWPFHLFYGRKMFGICIRKKHISTSALICKPICNIIIGKSWVVSIPLILMKTENK